MRQRLQIKREDGTFVLYDDGMVFDRFASREAAEAAQADLLKQERVELLKLVRRADLLLGDSPLAESKEGLVLQLAFERFITVHGGER